MPEPDKNPMAPESDGKASANDSQMTPEQLAEAKEKGRKELACTLVDKFVDLAYLTVAAVWLSEMFDARLIEWGLAAPWLRVAALFGMITGVHLCLSFPLSFYAGHLLEHQYGLSNQSWVGWLRRYALRHLLGLTLGTLMFIGWFAIIWWTGAWWWLVSALVFFAVSILLGQLAPVMILPLFYKIEKLTGHDVLAERLAHLTDGTGLTIEGVYRMEMSAETSKANAMLAGLGRTRRIIMGDTLLDNFNDDEIEVVFAHEIGHQVFRHIPKLIAFGLTFTLGTFLLCDAFLRGYFHVGSAAMPYAALPPHVIGWLMLFMTLVSTLFEPFHSWLSRVFERQADRYALDRTAPVPFQSAFRKLARLNKADPDPHPVEVFWFHDHPPIAERLAIADIPTSDVGNQL